MPRAHAQPQPQPEPEAQGILRQPAVVLADNGHGTRVKLWTNRSESGEFHTISIERSFKRKDSEEWETQKVTINAEDLLAVARGLEKGHDTVLEKRVGKQQVQSR